MKSINPQNVFYVSPLNLNNYNLMPNFTFTIVENYVPRNRITLKGCR